MNDLKPGPLVALGGAVVLLISVFLEWVDIPVGGGDSGLSTDFYGLVGILLLLIALAVGAAAALDSFAPQVDLPDGVMGYTRTQLVLILGTTAFLTSFGLWFGEFAGIGQIIAAIGAALIIAGAVLQMRESAVPPPPGTPPPGGGQPGTF